MVLQRGFPLPGINFDSPGATGKNIPRRKARDIFWCSSGDSNPRDIAVKQSKIQHFSILVSIFVSILRKEIANSVHLLRYVRIRKVRIDFAHNLVVFPAAQPHGYHHRHLQMIAQ